MSKNIIHIGNVQTTMKKKAPADNIFYTSQISIIKRSYSLVEKVCLMS